MGMEMFAARILMDYPHSLDIEIINYTHQSWSKVYQWCSDQFGPPGERWIAFMANRTQFRIRFANECDLSWFALKWG